MTLMINYIPIVSEGSKYFTKSNSNN